jgi:hypothetical protein
MVLWNSGRAVEGVCRDRWATGLECVVLHSQDSAARDSNQNYTSLRLHPRPDVLSSSSLLYISTHPSPLQHPDKGKININMEALLRQSRGMCPFLHKTSPATLRSLSTSTNAIQANMSNLQVTAGQCPVMGKALAVQSTRTNAMLSGAFGGSRAYSSRTTRAPRAYLHTTRAEKAQAVDSSPLRRDEGTHYCHPTTIALC